MLMVSDARLSLAFRSNKGNILKKTPHEMILISSSNMGATISKEISKIRRRSLFSHGSHVRTHLNVNIEGEIGPYRVDRDPIMDGDIFEIRVEPQELILKFKMTASGDNVCFRLDSVVYRNTEQIITEVMSEQILEPMCSNQEIAISNGILHLFREDELHLRILDTQLGKIWFIEDGRLNPLSYNRDTTEWHIMITDHNDWSTGHI